MKELTQVELKKMLDYDPDSGVFTRASITSNSVKVGDIAGCISTGGYVRIKLYGSSYSAHRLAWLYFYGENPSDQIDHINGNPSDNNIKNLRVVTAKINSQNRKTRKDNKVGFLGVRQEKEGGKYMARIHVKGKEVYLGSFKHLSDAAKARVDADEKNGFHKNNGTR